MQLAAPPGGERKAREFFVGVLSMEEIPKPGALQSRGGCWFTSGALMIHIGIEEQFRPSAKAHLEILVQDANNVADRLIAAGYETEWDKNLPSYRRFYTADPFGNRIEFLEKTVPRCSGLPPKIHRHTY